MQTKPPPKQNTIYEIISYWKQISSNSPCIISPGQAPLLYSDLFNQCNYVSKTLNSYGLDKDSRVATVIPNGPEMAIAFLTITSHCTCAPLRPTYNKKDFEFYLSDINAQAIITPHQFETPARQVAEKLGIKTLEIKASPDEPACIFRLISRDEPTSKPKESYTEPDDIVLLLHTSGTTARPKIVPLTNRNLCASANNIANTLKLQPFDRCLNIMPLFHIHGLIGATLSSITAGSSILCSQGFNVNQFFDLIYDYRPTWYTAVPTMHHAVLLKAKKDCVKNTNLRFIRSSSQSLLPKLMQNLENTFKVPVIESYGMTEASHQMASNPLPPGTRKPGSVGTATGIEISIMNDEDEHLPIKETGEIVIKGPSVIKAYENNQTANNNSFTNGWFRTGDEGYLDEDKYLYITGRIKEIINRGGEKISPREIDEALLDIPEIKEAIAFAIPHTRLGETVGAAIVLEENKTLTKWEIQKQIATKLDETKVPEEIVFLKEIPKGATGKLQRIGLAEKLGLGKRKEHIESESKAQPPKPPQNDFEKEIQKIWSEVLQIPDIGVNQNYFQLGGDSILAATIITKLREKYKIHEISPVIFLHAPTIEQMSILLQKGEYATQNTSSTIRLRQGTGKPVFLVHSENGVIDELTNLTQILQIPNPIYGINQVKSIENSITIQGLASRYQKEIESLYPDEKIILAGLGIGGLIALELSHRLQNKPTILMMIDPWYPNETKKEKTKITDRIKALLDPEYRRKQQNKRELQKAAYAYEPEPYNETVYSIVPETSQSETNWVIHKEIISPKKTSNLKKEHLENINIKTLAKKIEELITKNQV